MSMPFWSRRASCDLQDHEGTCTLPMPISRLLHPRVGLQVQSRSFWTHASTC